MQFKHPEIFYFLVLLLIPIFVHLFQLQKFRKVAFTNVAFLKKISLETRKSSRLKKWLILSTRILGLLALLFTFSQPYFSEKKSDEQNLNIIYLDNSLSLNTNGSKGNQLRITAQNIIESSSENDKYTLLTNDEIFENLNKIEFDNILKTLEFTSKPNNLDQKLLEYSSILNNKTKTLNKNILISDFQYLKENNKDMFTNVTTPFSLVKVTNNEKNNLSIDGISIQENKLDELVLSVHIKNQGEAKSEIPIAIYNQSQLVSKRSFSIEKDSSDKVLFTIPKTTKFYGKIQITYNDIFLFDNDFYFHLNSGSKTNILSIGNPSNSLSKIYQNESFNFQFSTAQNINYNIISDQQLIILNELQTISNVLQNTLTQFVEDGGHLLIIPNQKLDIPSYNNFLQKIGSGRITGIQNDSLKITDINFDHPLYSNVFSKRVSNFQYPEVTKSYNTNIKGNKIISFENKKPFLQEVQNPFSKVYWFSSALNSESTNFSNSPLIVPTLYNIGQQSLKIAQPSYVLQKENNIEINKKIGKDDILSLSLGSESFIPLQQSFANKVRLTTGEQPVEPGFYEVMLKNDSIQSLAFNINKDESALNFLDLNKLKNNNSQLEIFDSVEALFDNINEKNEVQWLWKLFLAIAIVSLLLEILILKFFKT